MRGRGRLVRARDSISADDPAGQLVVSAVAFRTWALSHREEFGLVFANRDTADTTHALEPGTGGFPSTTSSPTSTSASTPATRSACPLTPSSPRPSSPGCGPAMRTRRGPVPAMPAGLVWVFMRAWSRLYGMVTLEVFGHLDAGLVESGDMFAAMMDDDGRDLGLGDDWPRWRSLGAAHLGQ